MRAAEAHQVIYIEEPVHELVVRPTLRTAPVTPHISVVTPVLPNGIGTDSAIGFQRSLVDMLIAAKSHQGLILWYLTPMALAFSHHLAGDICIYERMADRADRKNPPAEFSVWEEKLLAQADVVLKDGKRSHESERRQHAIVRPSAGSINMASLFELS